MMSKLMKGLMLIALSSFASLSVNAAAESNKVTPSSSNPCCETSSNEPDPCYFYPYMGLDFKWQQTRGRKDWRNVLTDNYPGLTIFTGERFSKYWGLELGYSQTQEKTRIYTFTNGENFFNNGNTGGAQTKVKTAFYSGQLDLNGYIPLNDSFDLIGSIGGGIIRARVRVTVPILGPANGSSGFSSQNATALTTLRGRTKGFGRLGIGAQFLFSEYVGIRGMARYESTSILRTHGNFGGFSSNISTTSLRRMFKDTYSFSVGLFCKFS